MALWCLAAGHCLAGDTGELARGQLLFAGSGMACAGCHTLQAAGARGAVGPVLDEIKPDEQRVLRALRTGAGLMPSFAQRLSSDDQLALARYVAQASGGNTTPSARQNP